MSERYFVDQPLALGPVRLAGPEAHHLAVVCRVRPGDPVYLFNGDGRQYRAVITEAAKRSVGLDVEAIEEPQRELAFRLEVAAPLPKGDRAQFLIEKLTELGATDFVPAPDRPQRGPSAGGGQAEALRHRGEQAVRTQRVDARGGACGVAGVRRTRWVAGRTAAGAAGG